MSHLDDGRLRALMDGELGDADAGALRLHLEDCDACRDRMAELAERSTLVVQALGLLDTAAPSAGARDAVLERIGSSPGEECRGRGWGGGRSSEQNSGRTSSRRWVTYEIGDTVTYRVISGERVVRAEADVMLVNLDGRAVAEFTIIAEQEGSFREGVFDGDPWQLRLNNRNTRLFDLGEWDDEWTRVRRAVIDQLAVGISVETFEEVLSGVL